MADSEQVLTQDQLDTMLAGGPVEQSFPAEARPESPVVVTPTTIDEVRARETDAPAPEPDPLATAAPPVVPSVAAADFEALQRTIDQLYQRLAQLESSIQQTEQLRSEFQAWVGQLQTTNSTVEILMASLQATVGYGAHESFICGSFQSQGNVAAKLTCTACGEENWWGWWPTQPQ